MSLKKTRFIKGIILAPDNVALDSIEGELKVDSTDNKIKATLGSTAREVITNSQTQELTNKTITSPVIDTSVSGTAIETDLAVSASSSKLASASAVKTYVDSKVASKDEASEITVSPVIGGFTANVQATLQGHQDLIDDLVTLSGVAANAESLGTFTGTTIPDNSTVKAALQAVETAHEEVDQNVNDLITLSGVAENATNLGTFTGTTIPDNSTVKGALQSIETSLETKLAATGGTLTNGSIVTPARLDVKQDTLANLTTYALTASNGQIVFATDDKQMYQVVDSALVAVGGSETVKLTAGEILSVGNAVYISTGTGNDLSRTAGRIYKTDASNDDRADILGIVKKTYSGIVSLSESFESGNFTANSWNVVNGSQVNKWEIGTATAQSGTYSAYISNNLGASNAYTNTSTSVVWFYKDVSISSNQALYFYYKLNGESIFDCGRIIIDPSASIVPVAGTDIASTPSGGLNNTLTTTSNAWTRRIVNLSAYSGTTVRIIFGWKNDFITGTQPPIAIDAISIEEFGSADVQFAGNCKSLSGLTAGKLYYESASTPGALTATPPSTNGQWVVPVGLAVSATELVINPVASASAIYVVDGDTSFTIANAQLSAVDVTNLLFDGSSTRGFILDYSVYRQTDTASSALAQIGQLRGVYNSQSNTWLMSDDFSGQNAVTFSIQPSGQIQYTSSNMLGANYVGSMKYTIRKSFGV